MRGSSGGRGRGEPTAFRAGPLELRSGGGAGACQMESEDREFQAEVMMYGKALNWKKKLAY